MQLQLRGDVLDIKHGVDHLTGGGGWQHLTKTEEQKKKRERERDFSQEMQGRRVDEALLRDLSEFGLDEWSAGKEGRDTTDTQTCADQL